MTTPGRDLAPAGYGSELVSVSNAANRKITWTGGDR